MIFIFWMLNLKPGFSLSSFNFIERLFSSSLLLALMLVSSAYLRLLIFLPAILIPASESSNPEFCMMWSSYKLNKQGDGIQPWHTPIPILNQLIVPCLVLTATSWPLHRFLRRQVVRFSHLFKNFPDGGKDGGGIGREDHFLPHKFLKRTFQRRANSTKQLL